MPVPSSTRCPAGPLLQPSPSPRCSRRQVPRPAGASSSLARPSPRAPLVAHELRDPDGHFVSLVAAVDSQASTLPPPADALHHPGQPPSPFSFSSVLLHLPNLSAPSLLLWSGAPSSAPRPASRRPRSSSRTSPSPHTSTSTPAGSARFPAAPPSPWGRLPVARPASIAAMEPPRFDSAGNGTPTTSTARIHRLLPPFTSYRRPDPAPLRPPIPGLLCSPASSASKPLALCLHRPEPVSPPRVDHALPHFDLPAKPKSSQPACLASSSTGPRPMVRPPPAPLFPSVGPADSARFWFFSCQQICLIIQ
ncbi:predicted GPI-anchored protein 58 [Triticum aestivum]|uniref:predicted GPI-anchored protein 58 n=1 Tax=Triticum aestivum TaxID=4565 RepID=UPI001D02FE09|nr:predicted GPI-anchored protein 58 [Triticum aestivum]